MRVDWRVTTAQGGIMKGTKRSFNTIAAIAMVMSGYGTAMAVEFTAGPSVRVIPNDRLEFSWSADVGWGAHAYVFDNPNATGGPVIRQESVDSLGTPVFATNDVVRIYVRGTEFLPNTRYFFRRTMIDQTGTNPVPLVTQAPLPSFFTGGVLIDFETILGITPGTSQQGAGVQTGARLSTQLQMSRGVSFSSTAAYVAVVNLTSGHATSGAIGIGGVDSSNIIRYNQPVVIRFTMPGSPSIPAVTNFVSIRGDQRPATGSATMEAFDANGALIGTVTAADVAGGLTLSLSVPGIHSIRLTQTRSDIAFDDLQFDHLRAAASDPPTANAGADQPTHAGQTVTLDGSASSDDNTATENLIFAWTLISKPDGSIATLANPDSANPSFVADVPGEYVGSLIVTDEDGQTSDPDSVVISSLNAAPVADAGADQATFVGQQVMLDGSVSSDADNDALGFSWMLAAPEGSAAVLSGETTAFPTFTPDIAGMYTATLTVSDPYGGVSVDSVAVSAITTGEFAADQISCALNLLGALTLEQLTTKGNRQALTNFLTQALSALRAGDTDETVSKLRHAIERTDGCVLRGAPDGNGSGRDWVTDCAAQAAIYEKLNAALSVLSP